MMFGILLFLRMNLPKLDRMYFIDTLNFVLKNVNSLNFRFQKIFPTTSSHGYHEFFEGPRYYNMLFDAWECKYSEKRDEGKINITNSEFYTKLIYISNIKYIVYY